MYLVVFWGPSNKNDERQSVTLTTSINFSIQPERSTGDARHKGIYVPERPFATTRESYTIPASHRRSSMGFIERIFGVSPDGGDGTLELLYVVSIAAAITVVSREFYRRRKLRQTRDESIDKAELGWFD
jgi:hypothetical protein